MAYLPEGHPAPIDGLLANVQPTDKSFHAYLHIPFCKVRCGYCDFNTYTASELRGVSQQGFAAHLAAEIQFSKRVLDESGVVSRPVETIFFGGGTPTQLPASDLAGLVHILRETFGVADGAEVTTEANPDDVNLDYLTKLREAGFTRVSFGMQSAVPSVLRVLDRTHTPERVPMVVDWAKQAGLQVSVDLIYGSPNETIDDWRESLNAAVAMSPDHISAYSLIVEPGTKMARNLAKGVYPLPDEDLQAEMYELADLLLSEAGFEWYEVSNWAKSPERQSRHNLAYWRGNDWWGYGPGAHSFVAGTRWWNQKHPAAYVAPLVQGLSPALGREELSSATRLEERVLLELRVREGLDIQVLKNLDGFEPTSIAGLIADRLVDPAQALSGKLVLTLRGRLLADLVVRKLLVG
ncbi:MAG: radical SAM family heme chaperone HemW [Micrococcales bacterium]